MPSQLKNNQKKSIHALLMAIFSFSLLVADEANIIQRDNWMFNEVNASATSIPSNLKFYKYFDVMPDQIEIPIIENRDLSAYQGKNIYIGYGIVDPRGDDCRVFEKGITGLPNDIKICLPWWRIERQYKKQVLPVNDSLGLLCSLPTPKPPITVNVCKQWSPDLTISTEGGKVTCTSYYDRLAGLGCWNNPSAKECFVNNCSKYIQENCINVGAEMGEKTDLIGAKIDGSQTYEQTTTKTNLVTYQYQCPAGILLPNKNCLEEQSVLMYPYQCTPDNPSTTANEEQLIYCDQQNVQYGGDGKVLGFLGDCNGTTVMCEVNKFAAVERQCVQDITKQVENLTYAQDANERTFNEVQIDVLSGEPDIYSANENCLRTNTVDDARNQIVYAKIQGSGGIDDDIYVLKHNVDGSHYKVYCNMQHAQNFGSQKGYNGDTLQCIPNNGNYSFMQNISIEPTTIVSIQQNTENENGTPEHFYARTHYGATEVKIDSVIAAPATWWGPSDFAAYPCAPGYCSASWGGHGLLNLWDNTTATLSLMFPYAGAYQLFFYDKNGNQITTHTIGTEDFVDMQDSFLQLKLGKNMPYRSDFRPLDDDACLEDDFLEVGGGVWGGKSSKDGSKPCQNAPTTNTYIKEHAIHSVLVVDLLTGNTTSIPMVYPIGYINRIFVSKLKVYEKRKYRCYKPFEEISGVL